MRADALAQGTHDTARDDSALTKLRPGGQNRAQPGEIIKRDARIPVMLVMVANVSRKDQDSLPKRGYRRAGQMKRGHAARDGRVLADDADVLDHDVPGTVG